MNMFRNIVLVLLFVYFTFAFLNRGKKFCFTKINGSNKNFAFDYNLDNGDTFRGNTSYLFENYDASLQMSLIYSLLLDPNGYIHWVAFDENDLNSTKKFTKTILPVNLTENGIEFKDDNFVYTLEIGSDILGVYPYPTNWDFQNICFKRDIDDTKLFQYEIKSLNNGRKYLGKTYSEDPLSSKSQRIHIDDPGRSEYVIRVDFTDEQFNSSTPFCRNITEIISQQQVLGASTMGGIDPNALKSLVG